MKRTVLALSAIFILLGSAAFAFQMRSGYYVGSGVSRSIIIENGFQPDLVIVKADTAAGEPVWRSSAMSGDSTAYFASAAANTTNAITSLNSNGFSLGTMAVVNSANVRYTWTAFSGSGGSDFKVGSYTGNGVDNTNLDILSFQPDILWIKSSGASTGCWRTSALGASDLTLFFSAANQAADYIQAFRPSGFQVGTNASVNSNTVTYYYVAFKNITGSATAGTYMGDGTDNRDITGLGFKPDLVFLKQGISGTARVGVMRNNQNYGDETHYFSATANALNFVQSLEADGFQIGSDAIVNTSGTREYFAAFAGVG
ncbi:MAG TPA: hypothetical protein VMD02_04580, partial [Candidatus Omnitrophota bacterium]|nr:hypothetical protein [Candidatus Omnitrophota bacterium]